MRKLNLAPYQIVNPLEPDAEPDTYDLRNSMGEVLLAADQNLSASQLLANHDLFRKLRDHPEDTILLEEAEYAVVLQAFETVSGFTKNDVEMVDRVLNAESVEVQEKVEAPAVNGAEAREQIPVS